MVPVALFLPNIIGYFRCITGMICFYWIDSNPRLFCWIYFISYILDAFDGVAARKFDQCSRFGAVLDMVCDRFCTAALYLGLATIFPEKKYFYTLMLILDITSHWMQMYSATLVGKSHKAIEKKECWILRFYYVVPYSLFFVCLMNETWIMSEYMTHYIANGVLSGSWDFFWNWYHSLFFPVFVFKQIVSVVALVDSASKVIAFDEEEREKRNLKAE